MFIKSAGLYKSLSLTQHINLYRFGKFIFPPFISRLSRYMFTVLRCLLAYTAYILYLVLFCGDLFIEYLLLFLFNPLLRLSSRYSLTHVCLKYFYTWFCKWLSGLNVIKAQTVINSDTPSKTHSAQDLVPNEEIE